jgi:nitrate reductase molybdenum cofactor assembly chaperone NarJ/NarW
VSTGLTDRRGVAPAELAARLASLATLLEYPCGRSISAAIACRSAIATDLPEAAAAVGRFLEWLANEPAEAQEEVYTRTFLVMPSCVPYVSVHLFGDESFRRGRLMARLREAYDGRGFDPGTELPDHLAVLLRFAPLLDPEDLDELVRCCLAGPVAKMVGQLERTRNPYLHVLEAVRLALEAWDTEPL